MNGNLYNLYLSANQPISIPVGIYIYKYININTFLHKMLSTNEKWQKPWYDDVIVTEVHMVYDKDKNTTKYYEYTTRMFTASTKVAR